MESKLIASGKDLMSSSLAEMDEVWNEIKKDEP
jgi:uncharacterized protein YabN with tetrapyrrole methylase and pyrophosphatase domain